MSHPYNFATYILRRVTIVYPFIGNYSRPIRYCIKPGIFSGPGAWRFFFFPHHGNPAAAPPGAAPAVLRDGCEGAGQGLRRFASQRRCSRSGGALPGGCGSDPGFLADPGPDHFAGDRLVAVLVADQHRHADLALVLLPDLLDLSGLQRRDGGQVAGRA